MKFVIVNDMNGSVHYLNKKYIVRLEPFNDYTLISMSDGVGIKAKIIVQELVDLLDTEI